MGHWPLVIAHGNGPRTLTYACDPWFMPFAQMSDPRLAKALGYRSGSMAQGPWACAQDQGLGPRTQTKAHN